MLRWPIVLFRSRVRRFARRHRVVRWCAVAVLALTTSGYLHDTVRAAEQSRARWGETTAVLVAQVGVEAGDEIEPSHVVLTEVPSAVAPSTALHQLPAGLIANRSLVSGEIVLEGHVGIGGAMPAGSRGLAVPISGAIPSSPPAISSISWRGPIRCWAATVPRRPSPKVS